MSTNVFIWIKHGTHRWFEQIRFPNFQNYPPIFRPRIIVHGPEAKFSEIGTTRRDKGSYVFFDRSMYVDNEMR